MEALRYLSLISQVGFTMVTPVLLCTFIGIKLEEKFHFPFTLIFLLLGVISGCMSGYRLIMNSIKKMEKDKVKREIQIQKTVLFYRRKKVGFLIKRMSKDTRRTCLYMSMGVLLYELILSLAAIFFARFIKYSITSIELGILVGTVLVLAMVIDMGISTEDSLYGGTPSYAQRKIMIHSLLRKVVLFIVVAIFWNSRYINAFMIVISVFGLKSGAYMYPLFKKIFEKRRKEET